VLVDKRQQLTEKHILKLDPFEPQKLDRKHWSNLGYGSKIQHFD
jgi:hypothetical protein